MRRLTGILLGTVLLMLFSACNDTETYKEKRDKEIAAINNYIAKKNVKVITEKQFFLQDSTTDVSKNEYVLFEASGVYMQIVRKGCGQKLKNGETANVLCRFTEYNLKLGTDSVTLSNQYPAYDSYYEKLSVTNSSGTFSGSFDANSSLMYSAYGSSYSYTSVPTGWLVPFGYIRLGRLVEDGDEIARVRIIVPHKQGHMSAANSVTPYLYDITLERGR